MYCVHPGTNSKLYSGRSLRRARSSGPADASCRPSRGRSSGPRRHCGRNSRFKIKDSKLNLSANHAWAFISVRAAACGGCNDIEELQASAAPGCGPPAPLRAQFKIQNSRFKIKFVRKSCLNVYFGSGCSLRRAQRRRGVAGLSRRKAAARSVLMDRFQTEASPQPSGGLARADLQDAKKQPSARGRLQAAAIPYRNRKFKIKNEELKRSSRRNLRSTRKFGNELRAFTAPGRCPPMSGGIDSVRKTNRLQSAIYGRSALKNSHSTTPPDTETLIECFVPICGISIAPSQRSTASCATPSTSLPKRSA